MTDVLESVPRQSNPPASDKLAGRVASSPAALAALAKEAAYQFAKSGKNVDNGIGITVNAVTPGLITTEMTADIPEKVMAKLTSQIPVGRAGRPEEVARVVHFLAADASSYITGQVWSVNGGMDM
jgi:NAD(P)-dependent dehydrogenase (short-subunit alcohol dehydrogenase family)